MTFDLGPTDLKINTDHLLTKDYLTTKFEASGAKRSWVISCTRWSKLAWPLTLTFDLLKRVLNADAQFWIKSNVVSFQWMGTDYFPLFWQNLCSESFKRNPLTETSRSSEAFLLRNLNCLIPVENRNKIAREKQQNIGIQWPKKTEPFPAWPIAMQTTQQHFDQSASNPIPSDIPFRPVADPRKLRNGPMST